MSEETKSKVTSKSAWGIFLNKHKEHHYNFEESVDYRVSTGSLKLDMDMHGGFGPGVQRFVGQPEGGKTSEFFTVMRNFFQTVPNSKGLYIKSEGRLSTEMQERAGIKFVFTAEEWDVGTCFVFECNIYEVVADAIISLVNNNPDGTCYCMGVDSVDALINLEDMDKDSKEAARVAGGPLQASKLMQRIGIAISKRHMAVLMSQKRDAIAPSQYAPKRRENYSGGHALMHNANWILEFLQRNNDDLILQDPAGKLSETNRPVGHFAKVVVRKSPNEKTNLTLRYPIKYGRKDGTSIWVEKEIVDLLLSWEFVEQKRSWFSASEDFQELLKKGGFEEMPKVQGAHSIFEWIESNSKLRDYLYKYFFDLISGYK